MVQQILSKFLVQVAEMIMNLDMANQNIHRLRATTTSKQLKVLVVTPGIDIT